MKIDEKVYEVLRRIPKGKVTTYGIIAEKIGLPGGARAVGNALHRNPDPDLNPCFRVVNRDGKLAVNFGAGGLEGQKERLRRDGIKVDGFKVDLKKYLWK